MKTPIKLFTISLLLLILIVPTRALAAAAITPAADTATFLRLLMEVVQIVKGMTALAAGLMLLVNFCKSRGWIKDDTADIVFQCFNLVAIVVLATVKYFNPNRFLRGALLGFCSSSKAPRKFGCNEYRVRKPTINYCFAANAAYLGL